MKARTKTMQIDSDLLIREQPMMVLPSLAKLIGFNEALVLQQIHDGVDDTTDEDDEGQQWLRKSYTEWHKHFPFWSINTVKRTFAALRERGLIMVRAADNPHEDTRNWYAVDYDAVDKLVATKKEGQ